MVTGPETTAATVLCGAFHNAAKPASASTAQPRLAE